MEKNENFKNLDMLIQKINEISLDQSDDFLEEELFIITDSYLQAYQKNDYKALHQMLKEQRKLRKELTKKLRTCYDQTMIIASKFLQTYNIFNKLVQEENYKQTFKLEMDFIKQTHNKTKVVLWYLYKNDCVQHKTLKEKADMPASTLTNLLQLLEDVECVEKIKSGKNSFYRLTNEGCQYADNMFRDNEEIIIEEGDFRINSLGIMKNRYVLETKAEKYKFNLNYSNRRAYYERKW